MVVNLSAISYAFGQAYISRKAVVEAGKKGCERGKDDRNLLAILSIGVSQTLHDDNQQRSDVDYPKVSALKKRIDESLPELKKRANVNCDKVYPAPDIFK